MLVLRKRQQWIDREDSKAAKAMCKHSLTAFDHFLQYQKTGEILKVNFKQVKKKLPNLEAEERQFLELLSKLPEEQLYTEIDTVLQFWKNHRKLAPKTLRDYMGYFRSWLRYNGIRTDDKEFRKSVKFPRQVREMRYTPDEKMVEDLINKVSKHVYGVFLLLAYVTGARQTELLQVKVKNVQVGNVDPASGVVPVNLPGLITKQSKERYTFLTPEAVATLKKHISNNNLRDDDVLFDFSQSTLQGQFARLREKVGFTDVYESSTQYAKKVHMLTPHRLRAACNKKLVRIIGDKTTEVIIGHGTMTTYDEGEIQEMAQDYAKAIPKLTLNKTVRLQAEEVKNQTFELRQSRMQEQMDLQKQEIEALKDYIYRNSL